MIEIKNRLTGQTICSGETVKDAVVAKKADLSRADLSRADLSVANLRGADLRGANLRGADLRVADLSVANLSGANLRGADLRGANLRGADLRVADLRVANLRGADLRGADLSVANLRDADLSVANIDALTACRLSIVPQVGAFVGWKKCSAGVIVRLRIPAQARRSNATRRKCRAEFVKVLEVIGATVGVTNPTDGVRTEYEVGKIVRCHEWCEDRWKECAGGIHFYLTREEAEAHQL